MSLLKKPYNTLLSSAISFRGVSRGAMHSAAQKTAPVEHVQDFLQLNPYDIWNLIFKELDMGDLLQCTGVCQAWYHFMLQWPEFWQHFLRVPHMNRLSMDTLIRRQAHEFCLYGPMDDAVTQYILLFLPYSNNYTMRKLLFKHMNFTNKDADLLGRALRLLGSSVQHIEFVDCEFPVDKLIDPVLESCSSLMGVSFSRSQLTPRCFDIERPSWRSIIFPGVPFTSLIYLKLCIEYYGYNRNSTVNPIDSGRLCGIMRQCPNLVHLFLDSGGSAYQGLCISQAVKHCPRLKTLVVSDRAEMPVITTDTNTSNIEPSNANTVKGLSTLVLSGGRIQMESGDIISVYKAAHKSLDILYLHYGGGYGAINADVLAKFARWTAPCLREVRLSTEAGGADACYKQRQPVTVALAMFLSKCPTLEVIRIEDTFSTGYNPREGRFDVDDQVLKAIANNCLLLRCLTVIGRRCHTNSGILYFGRNGGKKLEYLEIDTYRKNLWTLVKDLNRLMTLHIRKDSLFHSDTIDPSDIPAINYTLQERGGSLVLPVNEYPEPIRSIDDIKEENNKDVFTL